MILYPTNPYQTPITEELRDSLSKEVWDDFMDAINNIEFVRRLISPERKKAKDLPRDKWGRILVDICNPHILEDMDYFRQAAIHYKKYGCYTNLLPDMNPKSEYGQWIGREVTRCLDGMVRPSDGEWIPGDLYFYLNYLPIIQTKIRKGTKIGDRVVDFPEVWEGVYLRFHYQWQARNGGMYDDFVGAKHAVEIASRGRSKSYSAAAIMCKMFLLGESFESSEKVKCLITSYQKEYLIKDGTLNKFVDGIDFCSKYTQFPRSRLKNSVSDMQWISGYIDKETNIPKGSQNEVLGVAIKDDPDKIRGKRSNRMFYEEFGAFPKFLDVWQTALPNVQENNIAFGQAVAFGTGGSEGCLTGNNFVFTGNGAVKLVKDLQINDTIIGYDLSKESYTEESITYLNVPTLKECVKITTNSGRTLECSIDHPIYSSTKSDYNERLIWQWHKAADLKKGNYVAICQEVPVFKNVPIFDARLIGLLIGDGSYITSPRITTCDEEIKAYIRNNYKTTIYNKPYRTKSNKVLEEIGIKGIRPFLRDLGIYGQSRNHKRLPSAIFKASKQDVCLLIAGLIDTDGNVNNTFSKIRKKWSSTISIATSCKELAQQIQLLLQKIGVYSNIVIKKPSKNINKQIVDKNSYYNIEISTKDSILNLHKNVSLLIKYKQDALNKAASYCSLKRSGRTTPFYREKITNINYIGKQEIYNISTTNTHTYLGNGIITHNSDFIGALEMINYPEGYNVYAIPNVFDKGTVGVRKTIFFFPSYLNSKGFYNENGVSDVVGALIDEIKHRVILKYNSSDPIQLTRRKAEYAFTIVDAIMRRDNNIFPSDKLNDRILELDSNPSSMDDMWIGRLVQTKEGSIAFTPDSDIKPILSYPHKDNKLEGAIHINKMPVKGPDGKVPWGRYIAGIDPYDDDTSDTLSLGAIYVLDLFTDELVCEYVGRPMFAEDFYETCRRILMLYNAECNYENNKKGLFTYFSQHNSLYLLSDVLEFLKDKEMIKGNLYGNKAHPYSQVVYTPEGQKLWKDIKIGDKLFNSYGSTCTVIDIPFDSNTEIYELTLRDGRKVKSSADHLWSVLDWNNQEKIVSTKDMLKSYYRYKGKYKEFKYYIPANNGVDYDYNNPILPPYFLGIMLGDGCFTNSKYNRANFASSKIDLETYKKYVPYVCKTSDDRHHWWVVPNIGRYLVELGLSKVKSHTKFIPDIYKFNSKEVRLDLLQGLLDTDGHIGYGGNPEYVTVSKQLATDVEFIARSLGINCNIQISTNSYGEVYKVRFYTDTPLFKLDRKRSKQRLTKKRAFKTAIIDIKYVGKEDSKCVTVDSKDGCYLVGDYITTHNSKGTNASQPIQGYGRRCIRDWLLKPIKVTKSVDVDGHTEEVEVTINNINRCYYRALMQELATWDPDNNFDRYDALLMLMLLREQKLMLCGTRSPSEVINENIAADYLGNDEFFTRNYDYRFAKNKPKEI
jgi:intein/homing endonuclease